jgi:hypothetical protein
MGASPMDEQGRKQELQKVPTRKLLATIKQTIRREIKASGSRSKLMKKK